VVEHLEAPTTKKKFERGCQGDGAFLHLNIVIKGKPKTLSSLIRAGEESENGACRLACRTELTARGGDRV
jgi:hypothetical protein